MGNKVTSGHGAGFSIPIRRALSSNAVDATATQIFGYAIDIVAITSLGFTATQLSIMNAFGALSFLLLAVPIGSLVDRVGPLRILTLSLVAKLLVTAVVLGAFILDSAEFGIILWMVTLLGIVTVASENAQLAMIPLLSEDQTAITSTVAKMTAADRIAAIGAPVLVGLVLERSSIELPLSVALVLFTIAVIPAIGLLHSPKKQSAESKLRDTGTADPDAEVLKKGLESPTQSLGLAHGFRVIVNNRLLFTTIILVTAGNIGLAIGDSIVSLLVLRELELGSGFFGVMVAVSAVAGLISALLAPRFAPKINVRTAFAVGAVCQAVAALLPLLALIWAESAVPLLLTHSISWAVIISFTNIVGTSYLAEAVDPAELGRTAAARRMITMGAVPIAALSAGVLADTLGLATPLIIWPTLTFIAAAVFFVIPRTASS